MAAPSPSLDTSVPALTLKVGDYVIHHGGLGVARTLGRAGVPVYGVYEDRFAPAGVSRYTTGRFVWRTADQHRYEGQLLRGIGAVAERIGRPAVLVPTDDHAAMFVADHADELRHWFLIPPQSAALVRAVANKAWLYARCLGLGVAVPAGTVVTNAEELAAYADRASFPIVAKRCAPWLLPNGRRAVSSRVVHGRRDLLRLGTASPLLLQERIPPDCGEDWLFHAYCDAGSECVVAFTGRKLRSFPPDAGETALGQSVRNPILEQQARSLIKAMSYTGVVSLDYRFDRRDGKFKLLDFNPRVGAIFRLFQTDSGVDVIRALHLDLTERVVPAGQQVDGRVVVVEGHDVRSAWSQLRARGVTPHEVWASWSSVKELAWFAPDDVVPALVALARASASAAGLRARRFRPAAGPRYLPGRATPRRRYDTARRP